MADQTEVLTAGRDAFARRDWAGARRLLLPHWQAGELPPADLDVLADSAWWLGFVDESMAVYEAAYQAYLRDEQPCPAAMAALGVAANLLLRGDEAVGSGWVGRAARLLADYPDCLESGYLLYMLEVEGALDGDPHSVLANAARVGAVGQRHGDANLVAVAMMIEGRLLVRQGRVPEGMALLDEAMVAAMSDGLRPDWAGNIYCHLMNACQELADIRRARQWTAATEEWLADLPAAVLFTGICRVHRCQLLQVSGAWEQAIQEAARVCADLADIHGASVAEAHYQIGEICRLRGDLADSERAYQRAHRLGRDPQPGLAMLRLAQRRPTVAAHAIRTALIAETNHRLVRARLCIAQVEIAIASGDLSTARKASEELDEVAATYDSCGLRAAARQARGALSLAEGGAAEALPVLREACHDWRELAAPYETARVRVLLAQAHRALGDDDSADLELGAAAEVFQELGAVLDVESVTGHTAIPGGLTEREAEVLKSIAAGRSNRQVAAELVISEKTVARHLANIYTKLAVTSRTAAAAYAHDRGLIPRA